MFWLNACPRCIQGAVYVDVDNSKHCIQCGFVEYRPLTPYFAADSAASSERSIIEAHIPVASSDSG